MLYCGTTKKGNNCPELNKIIEIYFNLTQLSPFILLKILNSAQISPINLPIYFNLTQLSPFILLKINF